MPALWAWSVVLDLLTLFLCAWWLSGFEIHGVRAYALAVIGMEVPAALWALAMAFLFMKGRSAASVVGIFVLSLFVPLALAICQPGLFVAEWISPLDINGFWTYVAAIAITAVLTIAFRVSPPVRFAWVFFRDWPIEEKTEIEEDDDLAFRDVLAEAGPAIRDSVLYWAHTHRTVINWGLPALDVVAFTVGYVTVGLWFGLVLAVGLSLLLVTILWLLVRSSERDDRSKADE
jgi:hypothetical protein